VMTVAQRQQDELGTPPQARVKVAVVPLTESIEHIQPGRSSQIGAIGAMAFAALIVSAWGSVAVNRRLERRRPKGRSTFIADRGAESGAA
jgi:hypothetical protein